MRSKMIIRAALAVLVVGWIALAGVGGPYFGKISEVSSTDLATFLPKSSEATKVNEELKKFRDKRTIPVLVVYSDEGKKLTSDDIEAISSVSNSLAKVSGVSGKISPPVQSEDGKAAFVSVPLEANADFKKTFPDLKSRLAKSDLPLSYSLTGPASMAYDMQGAFAGIDGTLLFVALGVVFVILLVVYRSPFLPFIVLFSAMAALSVAVLAVYLLAKADIVQLNGQVQGILFILVIGAATDYALLYIARYREELVNHRNAWLATRAAWKSSYEPIIAAGGTVTVGLLCLLFSDLGSNKALGPVGGVGIALSVLAALTLLPSILFLFGRYVFWPRAPKFSEKKEDRDYTKNHPVWARVGSLVRRHPRRIWIGCTVALLIAFVYSFQLKAEGVPQSEVVLGKSESRDGQKILDAHFPSGSGSPAFVIADSNKQQEIVKSIDADRGVASTNIIASGIDSGSVPVGEAANEVQKKILDKVTAERTKQLESLRASIEQQMTGLPPHFIENAYQSAASQIPSAQSIAAEANPFASASPKVVDGKVALQVTLKDAATSFAARDTITRLRDSVRTVDPSALVGGTTASQLDTNKAAIRDEIVIIPMILGAITLILMLLLRSIMAPLVLLLTTVLSFGATLGMSAFLFNNIWNFPGGDPAVLLFAFVFLVALGIDYNIFLMTRVREETQKAGVGPGTIKGLVVTGGVITSAGIVLASTFASLSVIPILFLVQIAFIVTFGVLLDTIIVRSLLVPALTLEIGRPMWWPSKLWRDRRKTKR